MINKKLSARELLLKAGIKFFSKQGFKATSIRQIVDEAHLNVSMIHYYFGNKDGLLEACLQQFSKVHLQSAQLVLKLPDNHEEFMIRLGIFIEQYFESLTINLPLYQIFNMELERNSKQFKKIVKTTYYEMLSVMTKFFLHSQKKGLLKQKLDAKELVGILLGMIMQMVRVDLVRKDLVGKTMHDPEYRKTLVDHIHTLFATGVVANESE